VRDAGLLRIVVADEHPLSGVAAIEALNADAGFEVIGEAALGSDLLSITELMEPDVVLFVVQSPRHDGLDCLPRLRRCCPDVEVIVCSPAAERDHIELAFRLGACGFVMTADPGVLAAAVRRVVEGTAYHPSRAPARLANGPRAFHPRG
jgi:DNA-binding NarL/FixJ family response regulator